MKLRIRAEDLKLNHRCMEREINLFIETTDESIWRSKIGNARSYRSRHGNSHVTELICNKNPFVEPIQQFLSLQSQGKSIWKHKTENLVWLASTATAINRIIHFSSDKVKRRLVSALVDDTNVEPTLYEIEVATHYLINGYEVILNDLEEIDTTNNYDFLVMIDSFEGEIECKRINYDTGLKISKLGFRYLIDTIQPLLLNTEKSLIIKITTEGKLDIDLEKFFRFAEILKSNICNSTYDFVYENFRVEINEISELPDKITEEHAYNLLVKYRNENAHGYVLKNRDQTIIVVAESEKHSSLLKKIFKRLKEASKQFSGNRPSFIACYIEDIDEIDWELLRNNSALGQMTVDEFFKDERMKHVNFVTYSSRGKIKERGNIIQYGSPTLRFKNSKSEFSAQDLFFLRIENRKIQVL